LLGGFLVIIIIGLVILIVAVIVAVIGALANSGSGHALPHDFAVLGYHVTGSTGTLFLYGIVVGAAGLLGLSLLLTGARRTSRRGRDARRGLTQSRRETAAVRQDRDDMIGQRDTARADAATNGRGTTGSDGASQPGAADAEPGRGIPADAPAPAASPVTTSRP
jgi:hypothetical protein